MNDTEKRINLILIHNYLIFIVYRSLVHSIYVQSSRYSVYKLITNDSSELQLNFQIRNYR